MRSTNIRRLVVASTLFAGVAVTAVTTPADAAGQSHGQPSFPGIVRTSGTQLLWALRYSHDGGSSDTSFTYGAVGDVPVVGDWTGKGYDSIGVVRDNGNDQWQWHLRNSNSSGAADITFTYGRVSTDTPIVGDWTGQGKTTIGVARDNGNDQWQFLLRNSNTGGTSDIQATYGAPSLDVPIVGDWTGQGKTTIGVARTTGSSWRWLLRNSNTSGTSDIDFYYGDARPIVGDWTGQGKTTIGEVDGNVWNVRTSNSGGSATYSFGFGTSSEYKYVAGNWAKPRTIGQARMDNWGWSGSGSQWPCLEDLWTAESNWNPLAINGSSGAYGIPQSLPANKMAIVDADYLTDPTTQITWGLDYIADRYGTPCSAWSFWQTNHWY